jgi:hypothetical protein
MAKTIVGLFDYTNEAQDVVKELIDNGFRREDISIVANSPRNEMGTDNTAATNDADILTGAGTGAVAGGVVGGGLGLVLSLIGAVAVPVVGPIVAAGHLAAILTGAGVGAVTGGLIGGLTSAGVPKEHAEFYAEGVRRGGTLVTVAADESKAQQAYDIMTSHGAVDIDERGTSYRKEGWTGYDAKAQPYTSQQIEDYRRTIKANPGRGTATTPSAARGTLTGDRPLTQDSTDTVRGNNFEMRPVTNTGSYNDYETDYRKHYQTNYGRQSGNVAFEQYGPVYRFGYDLANDPRNSDLDWNTVERTARTQWETRNPNSPWEQVKDTVRYAWERVRNPGADYDNPGSTQPRM